MANTMLRAAVGTVAFVVMLAAALFGSAGSFSWPAGWAVVAFFVIFSIAGILLLDPGLIEERSSLPPDMKVYDLLLAGSAFVFIYPVALAVCGFDHRFGWSPELPAALRWIALLIAGLGYALSLWAARTNPFFSTVVRIQGERGHHVIDTGPYAFVRHPGYAGPLVAHLFLPILLGSVWGLVPTLVGAIFLMLRAAYEERALASGLPGYRDYTQRVRWRILPGLW